MRHWVSAGGAPACTGRGLGDHGGKTLLQRQVAEVRLHDTRALDLALPVHLDVKGESPAT